MNDSLLPKLAVRLRQLDDGAYVRRYRTNQGFTESNTRQLLTSILDSLKVDYKEDVAVSGGSLTADLEANGVLVFVDRELSEKQVRSLKAEGRDCLVVNRTALRSDRFDHGVRVLGLEGGSEQQTIFLDDPTFNFDYAHILPKTQKCSVMHGHTSSALVEIVGTPVDGMVVDFGDAKDVIRDAIRDLDHKLFINERYITSSDRTSVTLAFRTVHGNFTITAPRGTTVLLDGEATVENLAKEVLRRIAPRMPANVTAVGVYVYEGLNKGSHLLAQLHRDKVERKRSRR